MDTATRLEMLETRDALLDVHHRYAQGFDERDPRLLRESLHDDAVLDLGPLWGTHRGIDEILASAEASWGAASSMHHWMANSRFEIDLVAGTATGSVALDCVSTFHDTGPAHIGGRYRDRFARVKGVWKLSERALDLQFVTPMPNWLPSQGTEATPTAG